jgi:hypothetical protein
MVTILGLTTYTLFCSCGLGRAQAEQFWSATPKPTSLVGYTHTDMALSVLSQSKSALTGLSMVDQAFGFTRADKYCRSCGCIIFKSSQIFVLFLKLNKKRIILEKKSHDLYPLPSTHTATRCFFAKNTSPTDAI